MPAFLQRCKGTELRTYESSDDPGVWWCSFRADLETNPGAAFFCRNKAEHCVRAWRQAPSECQVCVSHKHSAARSSADEYIFFFSSPPPCAAALKSHFPTIWCKIFVLDGFAVCRVKSPVSWAALNWTNPTPLLTFSLKNHPVSGCGDLGDTEGRSWPCSLKSLTLPQAAALVSEALIFWNASRPSKSHVYLALLSLLLLLLWLHTNTLVINMCVNEWCISHCLPSSLMTCVFCCRCELHAEPNAAALMLLFCL